MTEIQALENIGKPFKWLGGSDFDTIREVKNGVIYGDWLEARTEDCRLKMPVPEQLKKKNGNTGNTD